MQSCGFAHHEPGSVHSTFCQHGPCNGFMAQGQGLAAGADVYLVDTHHVAHP